MTTSDQAAPIQAVTITFDLSAIAVILKGLGKLPLEESLTVFQGIQMEMARLEKERIENS